MWKTTPQHSSPSKVFFDDRSIDLMLSFLETFNGYVESPAWYLGTEPSYGFPRSYPLGKPIPYVLVVVPTERLDHALVYYSQVMGVVAVLHSETHPVFTNSNKQNEDIRHLIIIMDSEEHSRLLIHTDPKWIPLK